MKWSGHSIQPPRPETKVHPGLLSVYEGKGWVCQAKKNGTSSLVTVREENGIREVSATTRQGTPHKQWQFSEESASPFHEVEVTGPSVFLCELLHSKTKGVKDTNYLFDVLVLDGEWLVGTTYAQRYEMLLRLFLKEKAEKMEWSHFVLPGRLWLARNRRPGEGYEQIFRERLSAEEDEGLVLKNLRGKLARAGHPDWAVKCRKQGKNLGFSIGIFLPYIALWQVLCTFGWT